MKTLPGGLIAGVTSPVTRPGLLVEMAFGTVRRWSSRGTVPWAGQTWLAADIRVEGLQVQPFAVSGTLSLGNADDAFGTLILTEGVQDRQIRIWAFDGASPADPVWLCTAVGSSAQVTPQRVQIALRDASEFTSSPRQYVNAAAGFNNLLPAGTILRINGIDMRIERPE